ncbi:MAG: glycoside hydrolase family 3 N-terminal domain-containing protein, partial [Leeuwenhoekiella sp.]
MKNSVNLVIIFGVFALFSPIFTLQAQEKSTATPEFLQYTNSVWVDSIMNTLTPQERIAQLFMLPAYSAPGKTNEKQMLELIKNQKIGGIIFMQGGPGNQLKLMNEYQEASKVPLLGATDAEWGLGMRLDSTMSFPYQMALGAIQGEQLIKDMGAEIARQLKRVGLQLNFAPVVDVNNNPDNPVINYRSFGENKENVAKKGIAYMQGMQQEHVLTTAKHFPGHGDTSADSHLGLPQINHDMQRLDSLELYPFKELINTGVGGVMVAHLNIPAMDSSGVASTLSKPIITGLLKEELGFQGLIVTDAMNMKGVTEGNETGVVDKRALVAGNDLIEFTENLPKAIEEIQKAVKRGEISQAEIDKRCRKILAVKQWVGLDEYKPQTLDN